LKIPIGLFTVSAGEDHRMVGQVFRHIQVKGDVGEGGLESDPRRDVDVEDKLLQGLLDVAVGQVVETNERRQQRVEIR